MSRVIAVFNKTFSSRNAEFLGFYAGGWSDGQPHIKLDEHISEAKTFDFFSREASQTAQAMSRACAPGADYLHLYAGEGQISLTPDNSMKLAFAAMSRSKAKSMMTTSTVRRMPSSVNLTGMSNVYGGAQA